MTTFKYPGPVSDLQENNNMNLDDQIRANSESSYNSIVDNVVQLSGYQLNRQESNKQTIRKTFVKFFSIFLSVQFAVLVAILLFKGFFNFFNLSDAIVTTYVISVFVETLGVVAVMVRFAFDAKQEVEILSTLNGVVEHFQKYKS